MSWSTTRRSNAGHTRDSNEGARFGGPPVVCCEKLGFSYAGTDRQVIEAVSFKVRAGEYVGVVGPNGGGKSTLVRLLNGLLQPDSGEIRVVGRNPVTESFEVRKRVGMLFQSPDNGLVAPFVEDDVAFGLENLGVPQKDMRGRVAEAIRAVGLKGYERREPHTLSGGEKQRVALAGVLAVEPDILVLDEPTSMLDSVGRREILDSVKSLRGEKTILHVTHHLEELLDADRVLVLNNGGLIADVSPGNLVSDAELLRENRLSLPPILRLAVDLGLSPRRTPEELARDILQKIGEGAQTT
ncbi:energy-coupling factor ABC transporter ATP-binding protein [soil metagenome]